MDMHKKKNQLSEHKFGSTSIGSPHKIVEISVSQNDITVTPLLDIIFKTFKAVNYAAFLVYCEASLWMTDSFFLFGFEEHFEDIDHAAGVEDRTVLGEEFSWDGWQFFFSILARSSSGFGLSQYLVH